MKLRILNMFILLFLMFKVISNQHTSSQLPFFVFSVVILLFKLSQTPPVQKWSSISGTFSLV